MGNKFRGYAIDPQTREIKYTSVSSMNAFDPESDGGCPAKWYFRYIGKCKEPETASKQRGIDIAKRIEHYLKTGQDVLDAKLERSALGFMPVPNRKDLLVEHEIDTGDHPLLARGITVVGAMDVGELGPNTFASDGTKRLIPAGHVEVLDWKSSSDFTQWGKTPAQLAYDRQLLGYGVWMLDNHPELARVGVMFSHGYIGTRRFEAEKRSVCVTAADIRTRWAEKTAVLENMAIAAKAKSVNDVVPNLGACEAFRGCFMRDQCPHIKTWRSNAAKRELLLGINTEKAKGECMSFLNRQREAKGIPAVVPATEVKAVPQTAAAVKPPPPWAIVDEPGEEAPAVAAPAPEVKKERKPRAAKETPVDKVAVGTVTAAGVDNPAPVVMGKVFKPTRVTMKKGVTRKQGEDYLKIEVELEAECSDHAEGMAKLSAALDKQLEQEIGA